MARRIAWNPQRSFARFSMRISIGATAISVAVMIVAVSLVNGFQSAVSEKVFGFWGHVRIQERQAPRSLIAEEIPLYQNDSLIQQVRNDPNIRSIHPFATRYGVLKTKEDMEGLMIKGIGSESFPTELRSFLKQGQMNCLLR